MLRASLLTLPLALLVACSPSTPAQGGTDTDAANAAAQAQPAASGLTIDASHLVANHWLLTSASDPANAPIDALFPNEEAPLQLDFNEGRLSISGGCNQQSGSYQIEGETLTVSALVSTRRACDEALMQADRVIAERFGAPLQVKAIDAGQLLLVSASGDTLSWRGEPTAQTRFGSQGEQVFWEVAATTVACPDDAGKQCLQVRPLVYDVQGLKQGEPGPYAAFAGTIEGYEHQPGTRNVLRLKHFALPAPAADGSSDAYVLDMVVESSRQ